MVYDNLKSYIFQATRFDDFHIEADADETIKL